MRAFAYAIKEAKGEIILTTDADCEVKPLWAKTVCSHYYDDVAIVTGVTTQVADNWFGGNAGNRFCLSFNSRCRNNKSKISDFLYRK